MTDTNVFQLSQPGTFSDPLTEVLRNGARALLAQAVEAEVAALLSGHADKLTDGGHQRLVRHGHLPEREIMTGIGPVAVRCPRGTHITVLMSFRRNGELFRQPRITFQSGDASTRSARRIGRRGGDAQALRVSRFDDDRGALPRLALAGARPTACDTGVPGWHNGLRGPVAPSGHEHGAERKSPGEFRDRPGLSALGMRCMSDLDVIRRAQGTCRTLQNR